MRLGQAIRVFCFGVFCLFIAAPAVRAGTIAICEIDGVAGCTSEVSASGYATANGSVLDIRAGAWAVFDSPPSFNDPSGFGSHTGTASVILDFLFYTPGPQRWGSVYIDEARVGAAGESNVGPAGVAEGMFSVEGIGQTSARSDGGSSLSSGLQPFLLGALTGNRVHVELSATTHYFRDAFYGGTATGGGFADAVLYLSFFEQDGTTPVQLLEYAPVTNRAKFPVRDSDVAAAPVPEPAQLGTAGLAIVGVFAFVNRALRRRRS